MLRPILVSTLVAMTLSNVIIIYIKFTEPRPQSVIIQKNPSQSQYVRRIPEVIREVNKRNSQIRSLSCDEMKVKVWQNGMGFRLSGDLNYEKKRNFRMRFRSILGSEIDLGSNEDHFWYWSRRNPRPGLFYAKHEDYNAR